MILRGSWQLAFIAMRQGDRHKRTVPSFRGRLLDILRQINALFLGDRNQVLIGSHLDELDVHCGHGEVIEHGCSVIVQKFLAQTIYVNSMLHEVLLFYQFQFTFFILKNSEIIILQRVSPT